MAYTIRIEEYQRQLIALALGSLPFEAAASVDLTGLGPLDDPAQEIEMLHGLFSNLGQNEDNADPDVIHGFCL